jgi:hypothetical protein
MEKAPQIITIKSSFFMVHSVYALQRTASFILFSVPLEKLIILVWIIEILAKNYNSPKTLIYSLSIRSNRSSSFTSSFLESVLQ